MSSSADDHGLPLVTPDLPGTGGRFKSEPADFVVEEIPLYLPEGEGEHVYLTITREGRTTRDLVTALARAFDLREVDVGYAGMKDKQARATQTFSLRAGSVAEDDARDRAARIDGVTVDAVSRHRNKLRVGHLLGNRFTIRLRDVDPDACERARAVADTLATSGLPNFFGEQRFGGDRDNAVRGRAMLARGDRGRGWRGRLYLTAWQSHVFNGWLAERMKSGRFETLECGDVAKKTETGGVFVVEDAAVDGERMAAGEITYTGPIVGGKMTWAEGEPGKREREWLDREGVSEEQLGRVRLGGSRRAARIFPEDLRVEDAGTDAVLSFTLPKGSYATNLLREVMKT